MLLVPPLPSSEENCCSSSEAMVRRCLGWGRRLSLPASLMVLLLAVPAAWAQPAPTEDAKTRASAVLKEGSQLYNSGDYTTALTKFQEAYALFPSPRILFNLGQAHQRLGRYVEATEDFERFLATAGSAPQDARSAAQRALEEMRDRVAHLEVSANMQGAEVFVDGHSRGLTPLPRPVLVSVGAHQVVVQRQGSEPFLRRVEAVGGTVARVQAELRVAAVDPSVPSVALAPPPEAAVATARASSSETPPPGWMRGVAYGLLGVAPVLAGAGLYYGNRASDSARDIEQACQPAVGCAGADILAKDQSRRSDGKRQWILLGSGAAALGAGGLLFILSRPPAGSGGEPTRVGVRWNGQGATATFRTGF